MQINERDCVILAQLTLRTLMNQVANLLKDKVAYDNNIEALTSSVASLNERLAATEDPDERAVKIIHEIVEVMRLDRARLREDVVRIDESLANLAETTSTVTNLLEADELFELLQASLQANEDELEDEEASGGATH